MNGLRAQFGNRAPSEDRVREIMQNAAQSGAHTLGVHASTRRSRWPKHRPKARRRPPLEEISHE